MEKGEGTAMGFLGASLRYRLTLTSFFFFGAERLQIFSLCSLRIFFIYILQTNSQY